MDIVTWLRGLGLEQYAQSFRDNAIDATVLPALSEAHLKELGLPLGHRLKLLEALTTLRDAAAPLPSEPTTSARLPRRPVRRSASGAANRWRTWARGHASRRAASKAGGLVERLVSRDTAA